MHRDIVRSIAEYILATEGRAIACDEERVEAVTGGFLIARENIGAEHVGLSIDYLGERVFAIVGGDVSACVRDLPGPWRRELWDAAPGWGAALKGRGVVKH
ncbi:hypothetical protein [Bradyrhizobium sp. S3.2.12]|uniref:hypothetical protein n=1 Tax=Bradyrhizobium sp. S3.2.12 TaxID=3156387 RepID=UPI003393A83A